MPYSGADDPKLPANVKKMPAKMRAQWCEVWNSSYSACQEKGGDNCESEAFQRANGVIKKRKESGNEMTDHFQFTDLSIGLTDGRAFDALAPGKFIDMYGRTLEIKTSDLADFVANTKKAIEATRSESGELVGLPIDAIDHDKGDGAGWIIDVSLEGERVRVTPKWTEIGLDLISKGIRRFFSATVDTGRKIIMGGTLTNWPASRDHKSGLILLRPVELSENPDLSGFYAPGEDGQPEWRANFYALSEDTQPSWLEGLKSWMVEKLGFTPPVSGEEDQLSTEENLMTLELTQDQLNEQITAAVNTAVGTAVQDALAKALGANPAPPSPDEKNNAREMVSLLGLEHLEQGAQERIELALAEQMATIQKSAETRYMQQLAQITRKRDVAEFSQRMTGGTPDHPRGLPVTADELSKHLLALSKDEAPFWQGLCQSIVENGLTEFAELGHQKDVKGTKPLPVSVAQMLVSGELKVSDLSNPILALGDLSEYDLTAYK